MKVIYTPDDGAAQTWDFDVRRLMVVELEAVEKVTGLSYLEFAQGLDNARVAAYRALVWIMRKRHGEPDLRYSAVDFPIGALRFEADPAELLDDDGDIDEDNDASDPKEEPASPSDASGG